MPSVARPLARYSAALRSSEIGRRAREIVLGVGIAIAGGLIRLALDPFIGSDLAYLTFYPAIAIASWAAGLRGGLAAVITSTLFARLVFLESPAGVPGYAFVGLLVFVASGVIISGIGGQLHRSREQAEEGRSRARFLADASRVLSERLDRLGTIESLTRVAVPRFADWCAIDLFDERNRFIDARIAAADPELVDLAHELRRSYPFEADASRGAPAVARTGRPEYVLDAPPGIADGIADPRLREIVERLEYRSYISVPLAAPSGRTIGVLSVGMAGSGRQFDVEDVDTAIDLGRRAGVALDHAVLFSEAEARRDELGAVINVIEDAVLVANADGAIRSQNVAARALIGDVVDRPLDEVLGELEPVEGRAEVRQTRATGRYVVPLSFDLHTRGAAARIAVLRDTTDILESEAARDAFVGMLSHEVRTPITTIFGTAQVLRRPLADEARAELVDDLAAETDRLYRLVEDLLVLSRFERGRLVISPEPVLVQRVLNATMARVTSQYPGLRIRVETPASLPPALADPTYVEQVIRNLASNAVKYAGETAGIDIRMSGDAAQVRVEFEDDGPGIPEREAERVFGLYERLGRNALLPGAGIGLFVCRQLVEAMGGRMTVGRGAGGGACFAFSLPTVAGDMGGQASAERADPVAAG